MKRDKIKDIDFIGKKILNFQITWTIILFAYYLAIMLPLIFRIHLFSWFSDAFHPSVMLPIYFTFILYGVNILFTGLNEVFIFNGKPIFYKPAFRFLR